MLTPLVPIIEEYSMPLLNDFFRWRGGGGGGGHKQRAFQINRFSVKVRPEDTEFFFHNVIWVSAHSGGHFKLVILGRNIVRTYFTYHFS